MAAHLSLREQFDQEPVSPTTQGCRVWRWLQEFDDDDRSFLIELLETATYPTTQFVQSLKRRDIIPPAEDNLNAHRGTERKPRRCVCPADYPGLRYRR